MSFPTKYKFVVACAFASFQLVSVMGCSGDELPTPASGGTPSASGGSPALGGGGAGGAPVATGGTPGAAGTASAGSPSTPAGDPVQGQTAYAANCAACHGQTAGGGLGPNISGSMAAGIGAWSETEFTQAVRQGVGKNGQAFCATMIRYTPASLTDAQLKNIFAYVRSVSIDTANTGSSCN